MTEATGRRGDAPQVLCLGELLIDMVPVEDGVTLQGAETFYRAAGGAPANVAVAAALLGARTAVVAAVGDDPFGRFLVTALRGAKVDVTHVAHVRRPTAIAFVALGPGGERDFLFYGDDPAHDHVTEAQASAAVTSMGGGGTAPRVLHFGSVCLAREPARSATAAAIAAARDSGCTVSCDVNLRETFWPDLEEAREVIWSFASRADIVKLSEDEARFLLGDERDERDGAGARLAERLLGGGAELVVTSRGANGATAFTAEGVVEVAAPRVASVDTTGAGDALTGAILAVTVGSPEAWQHRADVERSLGRACAYAALSTRRRGAIPSYVTAAELETFLT